MGWKSFIKRKVKKAAKRVVKTVVHRTGSIERIAMRRAASFARKHGRTLIKGAFRTAASGTESYFGGRIGAKLANKLSRGVV